MEDILDCMNHHQEVLREELQLAGMQLMISKAEEEERRAKYAQERAWRTAKLAEAIKEKLNAETQRWGKTVMAASTIDELEARSSQSGLDQIACYYFFGQKGSLKSGSTRTSAYRSIATQIFQRFHHVEAIHDIYALANDGSKASASEHEVLELLQMVFPRLSDVYIILDGVDECADCAKLVSEVQLFCANPSVKVLLFSRPHVAPLRRVIKSDHIISLSRTVMNEDIRVFLRAQLAVLADKNRFPSSSNLLSIEDELLDRADGMFLWARLMICYLDSPALTKSQRVNTIFKTTPVGLDEMYDRILRQIQNMDGASQQLAASVFGAASARELSIQQPLLKYASVHWAEHLWDCLRAFLDADTSAPNQEMLATTLSLLGRFLSHKLCLTVWVEAIYLYAAGSPLNCLQLVPNLLDKASQLGAKLDCSQVTRNISDFATEMQEIDHAWHDTLVQTPHEIWNDVTSFNSSAFLAKNNGISTHKLAPCQEDHPSKSLEPMFCVSANNTDCTFIGKIAIWPSRQFYECWNNKPEEFVSDWHKAIDHEHISRGWLALYEVHSIKDVPQKTLSHMISLPSEEISLQLQFSLRLSVLRHWKLKFPLAISSDLSIISVLRTIIKFNRKHPQKREEVEVLSTVPWRDHWERLRSFWRPEQPVVDFSYTYEWLFSPGSTFVVFRDCDFSKERGTFAILKLSSHSSRLDAAVIKKEEFYGDALCPCAIHPFEQKLLLLDRNHIRFMDMDNHEEYFIPCAKSSGTIKIEFSKCGAYYVLHRDLSLPEIHLLPKTAFTNVSSKRPGSEEPCVAKRLKQHEHIFDGTLSRTIDSLDIMAYRIEESTSSDR
ncbi:hypothetical protein SLS56_008664 [Neofusicoccum ribis]|uniref:Nephrocystin 3-like N-terminal domain-containing protein n=1 Tax=Neofusicoccum ribis TaxID=45134 RepID=A0ABR3SJH6_9PEZI